MKRIVVLAVLLALIPVGANAQSGPSCSDEKSKEFDFWIGEWEVWAGGELAGTNTIEPILDGCVLQENWLGVSGSAGSSLNFYNPQEKRWRQFWVWRQGTTLELAGGYGDGKMVLEGDSVARDGATVANRITWYDNGNGTVRQHWQVSKDGGESWETAFDGLYQRKKKAAEHESPEPVSG
jgi:hypothetical protein